jgi:hypothetical protein
MEYSRILRVVVASATDVQAERDAVPHIVDYLNNSVARDRGLRLEVTRWETDAFPTFHAHGPQGAIDETLRIDECDLLIAIFWKRFGTPVADARSGTEHELRLAYTSWQTTGHPQIMLYFKEQPAVPRSKAEADQWAQVLDLREHFPEEGLWWSYQSKSHFEDLLREHLTHFIRTRFPLVLPAQQFEHASQDAAAAFMTIHGTHQLEIPIELSPSSIDHLAENALISEIASFLDLPLSRSPKLSIESKSTITITIEVPRLGEQEIHELKGKVSQLPSHLTVWMKARKIEEPSQITVSNKANLKIMERRWRPWLFQIRKPAMMRASLVTLSFLIALCIVLIRMNTKTGINTPYEAKQVLKREVSDRNITTIVLEPYRAVRGLKTNETNVRLMPGAELVHLQLKLPDGLDAETYDVNLIQAVDEHVLFTLKQMKRINGTISIILNQQSIPKGRYRLAVSQKAEAPIFYLFNVTKDDMTPVTP